ncbi:MAG TPA: protein kinase [Pyrinomonadaceae bacterium]|nr:protein kinase [Pyrinomonadaceae bacterium]
MCPEDNTALQADSTVIGETPGDPLIGQTLDDKYRLEERLGIGGMGTVYRARHLLIDRPVAIKVLNPRFVEDDAAQTRFRREAKAAGRLQHPNAVTVTDFGQTADGYVYIVMELLLGRTLRDVLAKEAPLDSARAVSLMLQISDAVAAAHEAGIIHRDLKPANIFIVQRAEVPAVVKVLDFGIAKLAADSVDEDDLKNLTIVGAMIGTPRYMSPEQCDGAELTPAADVYSLGVILYEMLSGMVPFSGSTPLAIAMKHATEPPRSPREIVASIPASLEELVLHALEKLPEDRPRDAAAFRSELFETAERLGLEHAAITSGPNLEALRDIGTESPSGRLVIDISRLRENRAATSASGSSVSDLTVLSETDAERVLHPRIDAGESRPPEPRSFPRVAIPLTNGRRTARTAILISIAALALIVVATFVAMRPGTLSSADANVVASPSPSVEVSPSPSPTPSARRAEQKKPANTNANTKKESKVGSILKKAGRILKKPF